MTPATGIGAKKVKLRRYWTDAIAKRDAEGCCRFCGTTQGIEFAHLSGREFDEERDCPFCKGLGSLGSQHHAPECPECKGAGRVLYVRPESGIPLCGPSTTTSTCHARQHAHELDLIPVLTNEEAACAVLDLGLHRAYRELSGAGRGPSPLEAARLREAA